MNEAEIRVRLEDITRTVKAWPLFTAPADDEHAGCPSPGMTSEGPINELIDHLRLQVNYMAFDLEATRRENRYLRQMLETRRRSDRDDAGDSPPF